MLVLRYIVPLVFGLFWLGANAASAVTCSPTAVSAGTITQEIIIDDNTASTACVNGSATWPDIAANAANRLQNADAGTDAHVRLYPYLASTGSSKYLFIEVIDSSNSLLPTSSLTISSSDCTVNQDYGVDLSNPTGFTFNTWIIFIAGTVCTMQVEWQDGGQTQTMAFTHTAPLNCTVMVIG